MLRLELIELFFGKGLRFGLLLLPRPLLLPGPLILRPGEALRPFERPFGVTSNVLGFLPRLLELLCKELGDPVDLVALPDTELLLVPKLGELNKELLEPTLFFLVVGVPSPFVTPSISESSITHQSSSLMFFSSLSPPAASSLALAWCAGLDSIEDSQPDKLV